MEESRRQCCSMRRLAITAIACCWVTHAIADETLSSDQPSRSRTIADIFREKATLIAATEMPASLQALETAPIVNRLDAKKLRHGILPSEWELIVNSEPTSAPLPAPTVTPTTTAPAANGSVQPEQPINAPKQLSKSAAALVELPKSVATTSPASSSASTQVETVAEQAELDIAFALKHFQMLEEPTNSKIKKLDNHFESNHRLALDRLPPPVAPSVVAPKAIALPDPVLPGKVSSTLVSSESMIQVHRLRELANQSLENAKQSLKRGATHSARKFATESLRMTVDMQDAREGGNRHARQLEAALDAIRESEDFCGQFGAVDTRSMERMVAAHETTTLKNSDLRQMSTMQATEAYLRDAKEGLVSAAGEGTDASDALVMLGIIEQNLAGTSATHASAVALTMQRAAIEISPRNSGAYRELGNTLLDQGLAQQAAWAFDQSIQLNPTRTAYQKLLQASRRMGDVELANRCLTALEDPNLSSGIAIKTLSPDAFAASFRPNPTNFQMASSHSPNMSEPNSSTPPTESLNATPAPPQTRMSIRSIWPFGRR